MARVPLGALRVFEAAARCGSFKVAAAELSVTPGAVSRQIAALESRLDALLFERRNREVTLTGPGRAYYAEVQAALARIDAASERVSGRAARRVVRVEATPALALHWLIPRLPHFNARHHDMEVELSTAVGPVRRTRAFDWVLRRNPADFRGLKGEPLLRERSRLVGSPALARGARLRRAADLGRCRLIEVRSRPDLWTKWLRANGVDSRPPADRVEFDQTIFAIQAALDGLGIAVLPELFVSDLLRAKSLVCPLDESPVQTGTYYLIGLKPQQSDAAAAFRAWMKSLAA